MTRLHVTLPAIIAVLLLGAPTLLPAQACLGNPSFASGHLQLGAAVDGSTNGTAFGASFGGGSETVFGRLGVSGVTHRNEETTSRLVSGSVGYQVQVTEGTLQLCPVLGASYGTGSGPLDAPLLGSGVYGMAGGPFKLLTDAAYGAGSSGTDHTVRGYSFGLALGGVGMRTSRVSLIPSAALTFAHHAGSADDGSGVSTSTQSYGLAGLSLGIVFNDALAIKPSVTMPLGLRDAHPLVGLGFMLNYGGRR